MDLLPNLEPDLQQFLKTLLTAIQTLLAAPLRLADFGLGCELAAQVHLTKCYSRLIS